MALAGIDGHFEQEAVLVAVDEYLLYFLEVSAFFAFFPQFLSRPAEVSCAAGLDCRIEGSLIHIGGHKDPACFCILGYYGYQAPVVEFGTESGGLFDNLLSSHELGLLNCHH